MQRPVTPQPLLLNRACSPQNNRSGNSSNGSGGSNAGMSALNQDLMNAYVKNVLKPAAERDANAYAFMVRQLRSADSGKPHVVAGWLRALGNCASALDLKNARELLSEVFRMDFTTSPEVQEAYLDLVTELCTSHSTYVQTIFQALLTRLTPREEAAVTSVVVPSLSPSLLLGSVPASTAVVAVSSAALEKAASVRGAVVPTILDIVGLVPMSTAVLSKVVVAMYPHKARPVGTHRAWAATALDIARNVPSIREPLLGVVVRSAVQMDTDLKVSASEVQLGSIVTPAPAADEDALRNKMLADKLDVVMGLLLEYVESELCEGDTDHFEVFLGCFERYVLPTHRPKVVQFLVFKACAVCHAFADAFLDCMAKKAGNESLPMAVRAAACSYIAGFLARSKSVSSPKVVETYIRELLRIARDYSNTFTKSVAAQLAQARESAKVCTGSLVPLCRQLEVTVEPPAHALFYTAVQSAMYALCYAYKQTAHTRKVKTDISGSGSRSTSESPFADASSGSWLESLGFSQVLSSPLDPLRVCDPTVVEEFQNFWETATGSDSSLRAAVSLAESNSAVILLQKPFSGRFEKSMFAPFDPYLLRESSRYIDPVYKFWSIGDEEVVDEGEKQKLDNKAPASVKKESVKEEHDDDDNNDDDSSSDEDEKMLKERIVVAHFKRPLSFKNNDDDDCSSEDSKDDCEEEGIEAANNGHENRADNSYAPPKKMAKLVKVETICYDENSNEATETTGKGSPSSNMKQKRHNSHNVGDDSSSSSNSDSSDDDESERERKDGKVDLDIGRVNFNFDLF